MPIIQRNFLKRYAYLSKLLNKYILCVDDTRFMNHSASNPNVQPMQSLDSAEPADVAIRDIQIGEELTIDYRLFDANDEKSDEEYLKN